MRRSADFRATVRHGVRVGRPSLVVHARRLEAPDRLLVGFVVSGAVGSAVMRNRVKRRLRHLGADQVRRIRSEPPGPGLALVIRALPAAATAPERLAGDLSAAWSTAERWLGGSKAGQR